MMPLSRVVVVLVTDQETEAGNRKNALSAAGADVRTCCSPDELVLLLTSEPIDAIVIGQMSAAGALARTLGVLREEFRGQLLPALVLASEETRFRDLSVAGELVSVVSASAPDVVLVEGVARLVGPFTRANEHIQERLALTEKLETQKTALSAVRRATSAFAHDSGVLLGIVVGFACNLRDHIVGPLVPAQTEHVLRIIDAANSAASLLEAHGSSELFDTDNEMPASERRAGRRMLVEVGLIVENVVLLLSDVARQARVDLSYAADEPIHVWADALHVKQIGLNLVNNALKFTPAGGRVQVTVRPAVASSASSRREGAGAAARKRIEIVVSDTGPGVPVEDRERIFGRGVRLSRDQETPGSGIGLGVVRELVALHGGTAKVEESSLGGAAFVVSLPVDLRTRARKRAQASSTPPSQEGSP